MLVKAIPHVGKGHGETVCVAGITPDLRWRRLFPVRFRYLKEKFVRWQWVEYKYRKPLDDLRSESRRVEEDSISPGELMPSSRRAGFLSGVVLGSIQEAERRGQSLALIRPTDYKFTWKKKTRDEISAERGAYDRAARQLSLLDEELKALDPCPYAFLFNIKTAESEHNFTCEDWESTAAYHNLSKKLGGPERALAHLDKTYNEDYRKKGVTFAVGTHSRRPQWLLIGVIRLDHIQQPALL